MKSCLFSFYLRNVPCQPFVAACKLIVTKTSLLLVSEAFQFLGNTTSYFSDLITSCYYNKSEAGKGLIIFAYISDNRN